MKRFKVTIPCDYVVGHLRYGHGEAIIEAESLEEAKEKVKDYDDYDIIVDDYEISDYDELHFDDMKIEEVAKNKDLTADELLQVLKEVVNFEEGTSTKVECYENQLLLSNKDIATLLEYIESLKK